MAFELDPHRLIELLDGLTPDPPQPSDLQFLALPGGANNRVFKLRVETGSYTTTFVLKSYFSHPDDSRDRLGHEFSFLSYVWSHGIRSIPQPLASDPQQHLALYEYLPGRKLSQNEVTSARVEEAFDFYESINSFRYVDPASNLPRASESCFSIDEHIQRVDSRVRRLSLIDCVDDSSRKASKFVVEKLVPGWNELRAAVVSESGTNLRHDISNANPAISPSDFGFHNALLEGARLRFIDFEYAGIDDPAKTVCDFFCQPELPAPSAAWEAIVKRVTAMFPEDPALDFRIRLLLPVYQIKWCCILLNEFLPTGSARREFSANDSLSSHRQEQLKKVTMFFERVAHRSKGSC
jgi:hypothetical protein